MNEDLVEKAAEVASQLPPPQTKEDWADNGDAAEAFFKDVDWDQLDGVSLVKIHAAFYMKVGHKRLGRIYAQKAKSL